MTLEGKNTNYKNEWKQHVDIIQLERFPKQIFYHRPQGEIHSGRPRKSWSDTI